MTNRSRFTDKLFEKLQSTKYVLFNFDLRLHRKDKDKVAPEFLIPRKEVKPLLQELKNAQGVRHIKLSSNSRFSKATIQFQDDSSLRILFIHQLMYKTLTYMDTEDILQKRVLSPQGYFLPSLEHQFEEAILYAYLNNQGFREKHYRYFNDFHILVQEDLLEYFNAKYQTNFSSIFSLTDFHPFQRQKIVHRLKSFPFNRFLHKMNIRWYNFVGVMRQARMI